jgi:hypothetical protein
MLPTAPVNRVPEYLPAAKLGVTKISIELIKKSTSE